MQSFTILITTLFALFAVGFTAEYRSVLIDSIVDNEVARPQSRNFFQQVLINQMVNVLPANIRNGIDDAAAIFGMVRHEFLLRCLKELQAFQAYSKIDFITAIQKAIKFGDEKLTREQEKSLESLEPQAIEFVKLLFSNQLQPGEMNGLYDLLVKIVRQQIDGQTLVDVLPPTINGILLQHS
ncbi:unnamed protein product [Rotaria sordida]|uniref:Uncharacterized protein n=3 Tax=Rotaria sordida TaxID=392033 RepID=A0A814EE64_9BILA|nr:unnamed protein product [Rotaria sordida]CAF0936787.1 unnamed protein product [Rotaria sordida]CAF0969096.1 unnamed protein product [Rotaria sordida]CAF0969718.1 unnamed protein product [Rotaria sordida]